MKAVKTGMMALALFAALNANAQLTGNYHVHVDVENTLGRDWNNIGTALAGWICTSSSRIVYKERHRDYRGQEQEITKAQESKFGTTLLRNPQIDMGFEADMAATSSAKVVVTETCNFDPTVVNAGIDALNRAMKNKKGQKIPHQQPDTAFMTWECDFNQTLPRVVRSPQVSDCKSTNVSFPLSVKDAVLSVLKDKKMRASFTLEDKKEKFTKNFCGDNRRDRVLFHLGGGVGGHMQEHRFVFDVEVKNESTGEKQTFSIDTSDGDHNSGTLNDDIAYCGSPGKRDKISVTVKARTKHHIFKDRPYFGRDGSETVAFDLAASGGNLSKDITLYRNTAFGNKTEKYNSNIEVTLIDPDRGAFTHAGSPPALAMESH